MRRQVWSICLLLCLADFAYPQNKRLQARRISNPKVSYAPANRIRRYPFPAVHFERGGLAREGDEGEILNKIVYPLINKSREPIAAIVVTFLPDKPDITVLVLWHGDKFDGLLVRRNAQGHFDDDTYKIFFEETEIH